MMNRSFRYGTSLQPTTVKGVIGNLPSYLNPINPRIFEEKKQIFCGNFGNETRIMPEANLTGRYPSVSAIIGATDNLDKLFKWQMRMINQMGFAKFKEHSIERMKSGTEFHSKIHQLLKILKNKGELKDAECRRIICNDTKYPQNIEYCKGILPFLQKLKKTEWMMMEKSTKNHYYCYQGRFDAVIELDGEPTLVDWKTVSAGSIKSAGDNTLDSLYGNPLQIVAYINAVNSDPDFANCPKIKRGAVVLAFEDGRSAEVVTLGEDNIKEYTDQLGERINKFWWMMQQKDFVDFAYNPVMEGVKEESIKEDPEIEIIGEVIISERI